MKHIIIAEDDAAIADALELLLTKAGMLVTVYPDGMPIMNGELKQMPDLFLLDNQLAGVSGADICTYLKTNPATAHIPVIIMSASPHAAKLCEPAGADDFIEKPFSNKTVLDKAGKLLNR